MSGISNVSDAISGLSFGYIYSEDKLKEDEIRQGGNHIMAGVLQIGQTATTSGLVYHLAGKIPDPAVRSTAQAFAYVSPWFSLPICLFMGIVRNGDYSIFSEWWNRNISVLHLPSELGNRTVTVINFFAQHTGDILRVAIIAGAIALIILEETPILGGAVLVAMAYEAIDHKLGLIPRKVSLFVETYMPIISNCNLLISGQLFLQIMAICTLPTYFASANRFIHQRIDHIYRTIYPMASPSLDQLDGPLIENRNLSFNEINDILNNASNYEINPAHYTKWVCDLGDIPEDRDFNKFLTHFDEINWTQKYELIKRKLSDDQRFLDFLSRRFTNLSRESLRQNIEQYINTLAQEQNLTKEQYAANYLREQMVGFVDRITGRVRVEGAQRDLDDAIHMCAKILPYLISLDRAREAVDFEDTLLVLAVDGGKYCARGIKRAAGELLRKVLQHTLPETERERIQNPTRDYELRVRQILQDMRLEIVENCYQMIMNMLPRQVGEDVHGFDLYRNYLCLGFYPLTPYERQHMGIGELGVWETWQNVRDEMYRLYSGRFENAIGQAGEVNFANYIRQVINENPSLTESQKTALIEKYTERNGGVWTVEETNRKFHRLMLVMLDVMHRRPNLLPSRTN